MWTAILDISRCGTVSTSGCNCSFLDIYGKNTIMFILGMNRIYREWGNERIKGLLSVWKSCREQESVLIEREMEENL